MAPPPEQRRGNLEAGIMTALRKGWCPTLLSPMQSGDGWLARVKPSAGILGAGAARLIADAARRYGNGEIDLTSRANLQIRGLSSRSAEQFADVIISHGLASEHPSVESIRNVMASPLGADDPLAEFDSHALAVEIEAMLAGEPALEALPPKFGILVDGGGVLPLADVSSDIMVRACEGRLAIQLDGGTHAVFCSPVAAAKIVMSLALAFLHLSWERREPRMRELVMSLGDDAIFAAAGLAGVAAPLADRSNPRSPIGFIPGRDKGFFGVGLPFGRIDTETLVSLTDLCERLGDGSLRTTPWRALVLVSVVPSEAEALSRQVCDLGLIVDSHDPRLSIHACVGRGACPNASVDTRRDASRFASALPGLTVHVSGCAKGCAHRGPTSFTLVGNNGRYDLVRDGSAGDAPSLTALSFDEALAAIEREAAAP
jgi:precorrin-3B synthase